MYLCEGSGDVLSHGCHVVSVVPLHDRHEGLREELVLLLGREALPVLPEGPAGYVVDVEEPVGRAADLRAPLLARVEFAPLRTQAREPARYRRGDDIERRDPRTGDQGDAVTWRDRPRSPDR